MKVIELRGSDRSSKHDIEFEGSILHFEIEDCEEGVIVRYYKNVPFAEHLKELGVPQVLLDGALNVDRVHKDLYYQKHIHCKWYHRMIGWDLEKMVLRYVEECKENCRKVENRKKAVGILKEILEMDV